MKAVFVSIFFLLACQAGIAYHEIEGVVINQVDGTPIPYANIWLKGKQQGTSSDSHGHFKIKVQDMVSAVLIVSSVGYVRAEIPVESRKLSIELKPHVKVLDSVLIKDIYHKETTRIGHVDKKGTKRYYGNGGNPWVVAQYFPYQHEYSKTPFIDKISLLTVSNIKGAVFKIRIIEADKESGDPKEDLLNEEIIVRAKKGKQLTKVDISNYNVPLDESGVYIAFEWIITPENKYETTFKSKEGKRNRHLSYEPLVGSETVADGERCWKFTDGKWSACGAWGTEMGNHLPQFALELSN